MSEAERNRQEHPVVLLADSHSLFRTGMRYLLQEVLSPVELVEAGTRGEALALVERQTFNLVLAGLFMAEGDWEPFFRDLVQRAPAGKLVILSGVDDPGVIRRVLIGGAGGYILKETAPEITVQAIQLVLAGGVYIPPATLGFLPRSGAHDDAVVASAAGIELTERQNSVLTLLVRGAGNKDIARALGLSPGAVKAHVASLLRIFGATNRTELGTMATKNGLPVSGEAAGPGRET